MQPSALPTRAPRPLSEIWREHAARATSRLLSDELDQAEADRVRLTLMQARLRAAYWEYVEELQAADQQQR